MKNFDEAAYWVGCSTESALAIMFTRKEVSFRQAEFHYIAAFDSNGNYLSEAKVDYRDNEEDSYLEFDF